MTTTVQHSRFETGTLQKSASLPAKLIQHDPDQPPRKPPGPNTEYVLVEFERFGPIWVQKRYLH